MKIKDSVVIVTGASMGIGLALAKLLSEQGAKVVLAARSADTLKKLEKEIPNSFAVAMDMRKPEDITALVKAVKEKYGRIDVLVNNAGQGMSASVETIDIDGYKEIMELNVFSVVRAMQAVIPVMREQGGGMILNVSSRVSENYYPRLAAYASTKYALNAISLTAREELKSDNIIVSVFLPKMTATEFGANSRGEKYVLPAGSPGIIVDTAEEVAAAIVEQIKSGEARAGM
jgi:short-subunit dehydrogenase